jgi:hypothetical protein
LQNIFLVGGFGQSKYLEEQFKLALGPEVNIRRPLNSWTAVVRGAVLSGIEKDDIHNLTFASSCRRHYGVCADKVFSESQDAATLREENPLGNDTNLVKGKIHWMLSKGDLVRSNEPTIKPVTVNVEFGELTERCGKLPIYWYDDDRYRRPDNIHTAKNSRFPLTSECHELTTYRT